MTDARISHEQGLAWLLSRLSWPVIRVRERASVELGTLLRDPQLGNPTRSALLQWIASQRLESLAALGLLPFLRARMEDSAYTVPIADVLESLHAPSPLAWLLLNELNGSHPLPFAKACRHAETAPQDFTPAPFFERYVDNFLPPANARLMRSIERQEGVQVWRQWAFEWQRLLTLFEITPTRREPDEWRLPGGERHTGIDTRLSEVYRSAFLRAIAWAAGQGVHPTAVQFVAARTCPLDLDLWRVMPQVRPAWWPKIGQPTGQIDTTAADIWRQVETLWKQREDDDTVVAASGIVAHEETLYNLEIVGLFQCCLGPATPDLAEMAAWWESEAGAEGMAVALERPSQLRFGGVMANSPPESGLRRFADWLVLPSVCPVKHSWSVSRWQMWRFEREMCLPAPYLAESPLMVACEPNAIVIRTSEGEIGRWQDWVDGLEETTLEGLPSRPGQAVRVRKSAIKQFAQRKEMSFCWLCLLTRYHRENQSRGYTSVTQQRIFGASYVIRP